MRASDWSSNRQALIDGLWSSAVCDLPRVMECDCEASRLSSLEARAHDIWRMPLAIAYWLQMDHGVEGVWDRLRQISTAYQVVQAENDQRDLLSLVVMAAYELASESGKDITVPTRVIAERANQIANMEGGFFDDLASAGDIQRVGNMMKRLGFEKVPRMAAADLGS